MDSARWEQIVDLFHGALALPESDRNAFLAAACGSDMELMSAVGAMLKRDSRGASILDRGLPEIAYRMVGAPVKTLPFQEVGPYRLIRILGEGGMGVVGLAEREDTGRTVAIKFLLHAEMSAARREGFAREIKTLAKLKHPFIARLYDAGTLADGTPWFVMEYVEGTRLTDYCRDQGLSIDARLRLFRSVCEAVQYAYRQGIIHRDLKPSNILVEKDGTPRLLDFGVAKQLQDADGPAAEPPSGLRFGSPEYAAPEWTRDGVVASYTDVYSLGIILYEMLAGRLPATAGAQPPAKPSLAGGSSRSRAAWRDLDLLCLKAMCREAPQRYQSVEELIRDIDHYLKCEPLEAIRGNWGYRATKFVRRNRRRVLAASLASMLLAALVVFFAVRLARAKDAALAEAARAQRVEKFMESLFEGGEEDVAPPAEMKAVTLLDRGVEKLRALKDDPKVQAHLYQTLGTVYGSLGKMDQADSLLQEAQGLLKSAYGPDNEEVADNLVHVAMLRIDEARLPEAERLAQEALAIDRRHLPASALGAGEATATLGAVLERRGSYDRAIEALTESVRLLEAAHAPEIETLTSRTLLANAHFHLGHYAIADTLNRQILAIDRRRKGERHPDVAIDLMNLGNIQFQWGHYQESEGYFRQAVGIYEHWLPKDHPTTADTVCYLAQTLIAEGRYDEAATMMEGALRNLERAYPKEPHPSVAMALLQSGAIAEHRGQLHEAETDYGRVAAIYRAVYGDQHQSTAKALSHLADVYLDEGQYARAEHMFRDVIQRLSQALPAGHLNIGIARVQLGRTLLREQRYSEAKSESLAGYEILKKTTGPANKWLQSARESLVTIYDNLHQPEKAAQFRTEMAAK
jgi:tetratricopeptide (TPR) repeat protein/predicted Ser/Thr protein kinase